MGKKNKQKKSGESPEKNTSAQQQQQDPQPGTSSGNQQQSRPDQQQQKDKKKNKQQQKVSDDGQQQKQQSQQQQEALAGGRQPGGRQPLQQIQEPLVKSQQQPDGGKDQKTQQGVWSGGQQQGKEPHGDQQQQRSQSGGGRQQGAWPGLQPQRQQQETMGGRQQQPGGRQQQQGAWGSGQLQKPQQEAVGGRQQQPGGRQQQQGAWGGGQQQIPQQEAMGGRQQQPGGRQQQQRPDGRQQQQQGASQQQQKFQQRPSDQRRDQGQGQQYRGVGPQQQQRSPSQQSSTACVPFSPKSCNGIVRGTLGSAGSLEVNYLTLNLQNMPNEAYQYDVTIIPDIPKKFLRPVFEQCRREVFASIPAGYDGKKSCYTLQRLPTPIDRKVEVHDSSNRMKEFHIQIKETENTEVDLNSLRTYQNEKISDKPMRALQVLEVIMASSNHDRGIRVGRAFYRKPHNPFDLDDGYEAWTGLFQAAILGEKPLLNVDISHKSFPRECSLIDYLKNLGVNLQNDLSNDRQYKTISSFFKGIDIIYTPPQCFGSSAKKYKVLSIGRPASQIEFQTDDGKKQLVSQYFQSRGYKLLYPNLNCFQAGSTVRQISLPMELCSIPSGQVLNRKDQERQVSKMVRYAATSTNTRKAKIMELLKHFELNNSPLVQAFGLHIGSSFIKVPMRQLPAPYMEYFQGETIYVSNGVWRMNDKTKYFITSKPPNGHKWAIMYESSRNEQSSAHELQNFKSAVVRTSQNLGMNLESNAEILEYSFRTLLSQLKELARKQYDLVFVVLSRFGTSYGKIKQVAELEVGILTQCIKKETVQRTARDRTVFSNILLKVNGKLNGTNHKISQDRDQNLMTLMKPINNVMYLGADVTHPSPDQNYIPSVVGVTASHDPFGACYNCQYRLQGSAIENIEDMESITLHHLDVYYKYQKRYPSQIIYYRDGVSDGQFPIVKNEELRAIKRAIAKKKDCKAKLTCVIVVKRHHTRFFPPKTPKHDRDFNNVDAGTVVDQYIVHPNEMQFFMVSHQSIQGTARPTRYNVILDESNFDINLLQKLTYNLCHLFPRCNRSVSYPAPAYLAHLVASRGRAYIEGTLKFDKNLKKEYEKRIIRPEFLVRNPMYFI